VGHFVGAIPSSAYQLTEIEGHLRSSGARDASSGKVTGAGE
jgi:hypothetical protein